MAFYQFKQEQFIQSSIEEVWNFIATPNNLSKITPPEMDFRITSIQMNQKMYEGQIISYKLKLLPLIRINWVTEITTIKDRIYFIDEQRIGPYKLWHHEHYIEKKDDGVLMTDLISYSPPLGFLGGIANSLFIKRQLKRIFSYRKQVIEQLLK